jgi:TetR/AcrR family transcriptional regulator, tetracycline repressor protein
VLCSCATATWRPAPPASAGRPQRLGHIDTTARILLDAGFTEDDAAGISRLLAAHVLASIPDEPAADRPAPDAPELAGFPHLRRLAPAYARLDQQQTFQLGCEVILDGLTHRLAARNGAVSRPRPSPRR